MALPCPLPATGGRLDRNPKANKCRAESCSLLCLAQRMPSKQSKSAGWEMSTICPCSPSAWSANFPHPTERASEREPACMLSLIQSSYSWLLALLFNCCLRPCPETYWRVTRMFANCRSGSPPFKAACLPGCKPRPTLHRWQVQRGTKTAELEGLARKRCTDRSRDFCSQGKATKALTLPVPRMP